MYSTRSTSAHTSAAKIQLSNHTRPEAALNNCTQRANISKALRPHFARFALAKRQLLAER